MRYLSPILLLAALSATSHAQAQEPPQPETPEVTEELADSEAPGKLSESKWLWNDRHPAQWVVQFEPSAWLIGLAGDVRVGGGTRVDLTSVGADDPAVAPAGELHFRGDIWTVSLSGFAVGIDESEPAAVGFTAGALTVGAGAPVRTEFDYTGLEATLGARIWEQPLGDEPAEQVMMRLHVYGGARAHVVDVRFSSGGASAEDSATWVQPLLGAKLELELWDIGSFDVALDYGLWPGGSNDISGLNVIAGFQWRPWGHVGVQVGYRLQIVDGQDGDFEWDGSAAGFYGGAVIRF